MIEDEWGNVFDGCCCEKQRGKGTGASVVYRPRKMCPLHDDDGRSDPAARAERAAIVADLRGEARRLLREANRTKDEFAKTILIATAGALSRGADRYENGGHRRIEVADAERSEHRNGG